MTLNSGREIAVVFITAPDRRTARALATSALRHRLAACVNLLPGVESHYWWQGKLELGKEVLLILKTTKRLLPALAARIFAEHPYDTPEFVVLPVNRISQRYAQWLCGSVESAARRRSKGGGRKS
jgi:periplasmic divalent cation tolerance protein